MTAAAITLDVHTHLIPVSTGSLAGSPGVTWSTADERLVIDGHPVVPKALFHPEELVGWMEENGVQRAWVSPPPPTYRAQLDAAEAFAWARALNRGLAEIAGGLSTKLTAMTFLPVEHPEAGATLVAEATGQRLFAMASGGGNLMLSDAAYEPLWTALNRAKAVIFLHPGRTPDPRLGKFYLGNLLGNPNETAIAAAHLVLGGVAERFPAINFILAHGGGTTSVLAGRWQRGIDTAQLGIDTALMPPATLLRTMCVDCITHGLPGLRAAEAVFGERNVLFGSDWPFPMGIRSLDQILDLDGESRARIFRENAKRLL